MFETDTMAELCARDPSLQALDTPGLRVRQLERAVEVEWRLPPDLTDPTLQVQFLRRSAAGVESDTRSVPLPGPRGRMTFAVQALASVRAAAGWLRDRSFVPLVRFPARLG